MNAPRSAFLFLSLLPLTACSTIHDDARARAANEFGCRPDQVSIQDLGTDGYRAVGCGKEAVFVCSRPRTTRINPAYIGDLTTCIREGEIQGDGPPPAHGAPPPASGPRFDREAARAALLPAIAAADAACRERRGPHGESDMRITFAPNGTVESVSLDERFDGSDVAACLTSRMRSVTIAPFHGDSETLAVHFVVLGPRASRE